MAMILAIDAGNSNVVIGCMQGDALRFTARVRTDRAKTEDEYALILRNLFELHQVERHSLDGAILACVVSELTDVLCRAAELVIKKRPPGGRGGAKNRLEY